MDPAESPWQVRGSLRRSCSFSIPRGSQLCVLAQHARSFDTTVLYQLDRLELLTQGTVERMKQVDNAPGQMPQIVFALTQSFCVA